MSLLELRLLGGFLALISLLGLYGILHHKIYQEGYQACQAAATKAIAKGDKNYEKAVHKGPKRSDLDIRKSVCLGVYDSDYDTCVKSLPGFSQ